MNPSFVRRLQVLMTMTIVVMMVSSQHRDGGGLALVAAVDHNVGGSSNWDLSVDYTTWASSQTFAVGDNLGKKMINILSFSMNATNVW